jgi:hypothetical protein
MPRTDCQELPYGGEAFLSDLAYCEDLQNTLKLLSAKVFTDRLPDD